MKRHTVGNSGESNEVDLIPQEVSGNNVLFPRPAPENGGRANLLMVSGLHVDAGIYDSRDCYGSRERMMVENENVDADFCELLEHFGVIGAAVSND